MSVSPSSPETSGGTAARVTVVCSPRDHHHDALASLDALVAHTEAGTYELVYVLGKPPKKVGAVLRRRLDALGATVLDEGRHLVPSEARNLAMAHVHTEYVAYIDNDSIVTPGWLPALVACADDTGAALVGPLQFMGPLDNQEIHLVGGDFVMDASTSPRPFRTVHRYQGVTLDAVPEPLVRSQCDFAEFHCLLARREVLDELGPFDQRFLSVREVEDLCLQLRDRGETVWFEPAARATFLYPTVVRSWADLGFICRRWSERANRQSFDHFFAKHDIDPSHGSAIGFANGLRRPIFGPVKHLVAKLGIDKLTKGVDYGLHLLERPVNRLLVRPGPTEY